MNLIEPTYQAFHLLLGGDPQLWSIIATSLQVSLLALLLTTPLALALGFILATLHFPGRRILIILVQSLLALPTVVIGLLLYLLLSRQGALGEWHWLFTQKAMILGQAILVFPILTAMTLSAIQGVDIRAAETAKTLGASELQAAWVVIMESRFALVVALATGLGRVLSEVGCAMMVGGNIAGVTRNITTAIALETSKGELAQGIALGAVLVLLALLINFVISFFQGKGMMQ